MYALMLARFSFTDWSEMALYSRSEYFTPMRRERFGCVMGCGFCFMLVFLSVNEHDFPRWGFRGVDDCVVNDGLHAFVFVVFDFDD